MYALEIVIHGKTSMLGEHPWLEQELQKLLDRHAPFIPEELKVVSVRAYEVEEEEPQQVGQFYKCRDCRRRFYIGDDTPLRSVAPFPHTWNFDDDSDEFPIRHLSNEEIEDARIEQSILDMGLPSA
jgi:hypothetical protein